MKARSIDFRLSTPADDEALVHLLTHSGLPAEDVATGRQIYVLAVEGARIVGSIGLELAGEDGLVRSLAVAPDLRGQGIARALDDRILAVAATRGVRTAYLLTLTAQGFAERRGYERIDRDQVPPSIAALPQFAALCPATAVCMRQRIGRTARHVPAGVLTRRPDAPGASFWAVGLDRATLTWFEVEPGARFERHAHEAEQITLVLEGELFFEIEPGRVVRVGPGEVIALPSNQPHAAWAGSEPVRAVDAWSPPRQA